MSDTTLQSGVQIPPINAVPTLSIIGHAPTSVLGSTIALCIFLGIALILVMMRVYVRLTRAGRFFLNDYFLLVGASMATVFTVCTIINFFQGVAGHHLLEVFELVPERLTLSTKLTMVSEFCWVFSVVFLKFSILHLYVQVFGVEKRFLWTAWILAAFVAIIGVLALSFTATNCQPFSAYWTLAGHCVDFKPSFLATGILNLVVDILILILPLPKLLRLNMPMRRKFGLFFIFGIGFGICGISAWRIQVITDYDFLDLTYRIQYLGLSTGLEILLGVIIACIPIVHPTLCQPLVFFLSLGTRLISFTRSKGTTDVLSNDLPALNTSKNLGYSKTKLSESQLDRKNFKKLYNHLYPMSDLNVKSQSTCAAGDVTSSRSDLVEEIGGDVEVVREWNVQYSAEHV
ncbi:putative integral membrane protein [Botrytis fragariae]|uniref:Putative integral membrane protein n=1 Tax=Botrytis fragariae TaxID=1964551 RepID=A0A8H6B230_9HELO|nr:putative integral membrane protein [Botrytis fragariae]KAF5877911.1 putative integral membrane protein [Botrytis fragariae]